MHLLPNDGDAVNVRLIDVPYTAGDDRHPASRGGRALLNAGAADLIERQGVAVSVEHVTRAGPFRDTASSSADVNRGLAAAVRRAVEGAELPVVVAGSCPAAHGVLAGFDHSRCGALWLDAHGDFNTPESSISGFFPGMSLAVLVGHCYRAYWEQIGHATPVAEDAVALLGVRDLSPEAERERLARSAVQVVPWADGRPQGDIEATLDGLAQRVRDVYLHLDIDVFDPAVAPGVVDEPVAGGMSLEDAEGVVRAAAARFRFRAATIATFTPGRDHGDVTLRTALRVMELLAEWARNAAA